MPPPIQIWLHRLPADLMRRLELAEARAREARLETHARQALELVAILEPRMPFDEALDRYTDIMKLGGDEEEMVRTRALSLMSDRGTDAEFARERPRGWGFDWRYATPAGAVRYIQRHRRRNAEESLWMELAAARAEEALIRTHFKHALIFVETLTDHVPPDESVLHYINELDLPERIAQSVYQRVLARLAEQYLPRLADAEGDGGALRIDGAVRP